MNKTFIIIQREFMNRASKKSFILLTILMPFIFAATVLLPVMLAMVKSDEAKEVVVVDQTGKYLSQFQDNESYHFVPGSEMKEEYRTDTSGVSAVVMITDDLIKDPSAAVIYSRKQTPNILSRIVNEAKSPDPPRQTDPLQHSTIAGHYEGFRPDLFHPYRQME